MIYYFDPLSSPTLLPVNTTIMYGLPVAKRVIRQIKSPTVVHFASGRSLPIVDEFMKTDTVAISCSALEDIEKVKIACNGKSTVLGNLNGIEMIHWTEDQTRQIVKEKI